MDEYYHGIGVTPPAHPSNRPVVLEDAARVLHNYKKLVEKEYPNISSVYEGAKDLWEQVKLHWTKGKQQVLKGGWSADDFDADMLDLFKRQEVLWERLLDAAAELLVKVETSYEKVQLIETSVKHERGEGVHVAWMGLPTKEQDLIRKEYHHKLRFSFKEAATEHDNLCGYPDGLLTRVRLLRERADRETSDLHVWLKKKEHHHGTTVTPSAVAH